MPLDGPHGPPHSAAMSENPFIQKRQRSRRKATFLLGTRNIIGLIVLSLVAFAAFRLWVGNPNDVLCEGECESLYSLFGWVLGFFLMIAGVAAAGAILGLLIAFIRSRTGNRESAFTRFQADSHADGQEADKRD